MSLKNSTFLALLGALLVTILLFIGFVDDIVLVARGLAPAVRLVISLIETFAGITAVIFLFVFHRRQS